MSLTGEFSEDSPILKNVKLVGLESKKGRKYPLQVLAKGVSLYEGRPCYVDHPEPGKGKQPRTFASKMGVYRNARLGTDGIYADLHCNPKHHLFEQFKGWVDTAPNEIGLSHSAYCMWTEGANGVSEVTEIKSVESVDLVATPATTLGLFESVDMDDDLMGAPDAVPALPDSAPTLDEAISKLVSAIMADTSLDTKAKGKKILHVLKLDEKESEPAKASEAEPADEEGKDDDKEEKKDFEKKAEEALGRILDKRLGKLVEEAIGRVGKIRNPVSKPSKGETKKLTVETLLECY